MSMASLMSRSSSTTRMLLLITFFSSCMCLSVSSFEFQVRDSKGWVVPPASDSEIYNDWASENRFQVGDTIGFRYKKDSVMEVAMEDYKNCNSTHPNFFSNSGNTVLTLDFAGPFYFISGATGHCEKGQRMILKVMAQEEASGSPAAVVSLGVPILFFVQFVLSSSYYIF